MPTNKNGWLEIALIQPFEQRISSLMVGQLPSPANITTTAQVRISNSLNPLATTPLTLFGVEDTITFYSEVRDTDPNSPNFGEVISRTPITQQPTVVITGGELVTQEPDGDPLNPDLRFVTPRANDMDDAWDREPAGYGFSTTLGVSITFSGDLEAGSYQGDLWLVSGTTRLGKIIVNVSIVDADKMFEGNPTTVWYHNG